MYCAITSQTKTNKFDLTVESHNIINDSLANPTFQPILQHLPPRSTPTAPAREAHRRKALLWRTLRIAAPRFTRDAENTGKMPGATADEAHLARFLATLISRTSGASEKAAECGGTAKKLVRQHRKRSGGAEFRAEVRSFERLSDESGRNFDCWAGRERIELRK